MKNLTKINNHTMDLQLFASAGLEDPALQSKLMDMFNAPGAADPNTVSSELPPAVAAPEGATTINTPEQPPATPPVSEQPVPGPQLTQELIGGKFKSVDELLNAYTNSESMGTRKAQEAAEWKGMAEKLQNQTTQSLDPVQQISQPDQAQAVDPLTDNETLSELTYSDPVKAYQMMKAGILADIDAKFAPMMQERDDQAKQAAWMAKVDDFNATHPDTNQWSEGMGQILMDNPQLRDQENGLENAYDIARGRQYKPPQEINPGQMLSDPAFIKDNILNNEDIKKQVIQKYLADLQNGGTPLTIGQSPMSGSTTLTPPKRPANLDEAAAMAMSLFNK